MQFCYLDESGNGTEPVLVLACVAVDAQRMHRTKAGWEELFVELSGLAPTPVRELKSSDLYGGRKQWRRVRGEDRAAAIEAVLTWLVRRRHRVYFTGVDKAAFETARRDSSAVASLRDPWCAAAMHVVLQLQKDGRGKRVPKGHHALFFDAQEQHEEHLAKLTKEPPAWTDDYYARARREPPLSRLVDSPYFANSRHVLLLQIADLLAFVLRRHAELTMGLPSQYEGEAEKIGSWSEWIGQMAGPSSLRWKRLGRSAADEVFALFAPPGVRDL
ncbi:MAG TPA: DUF3800 domain-containing protein [Candidatus Limnocylindrales bacterium]|nr:DUF3800 domain-containing protein [Candidatus Limnocylindrales bacterium]